MYESMAGKTFAAINVGSNEISMKICEITPRKGARELDTVKTIIELGSDTYNKGYIEENNLNKLCDTLLKFRRKMKEYDVNIGVLTVPINIAQEITNKMVDGGIKAVWNFTPFRIRVPENIVVQNTSLYAHLAVMFNRLNFNEK